MRKFYFFIAASLLAMPFCTHASDIVEVYTLSRYIVVVHFDDGYTTRQTINQTGFDETAVVDELNVVNADNALSYLISSSDDPLFANTISPNSVGRKTYATEYARKCDAFNPCRSATPNRANEHWVYLYFANPLSDGKTYTVNTGSLAKNKSSVTFTYTNNNSRSEAIHVNPMGYSINQELKYAYLYYWAGNWGSVNFSGYAGADFKLLNTVTNQVVYTGKVTLRAPATQIEHLGAGFVPDKNYSLCNVYECNFSSYKIPGNYKIVIDGIGCSYPFKIGNDVKWEPFYWVMKGIYMQRSGIALTNQYTKTNFTRPAPHNPILTPGFQNRLFYTKTRVLDTETGIEYDAGATKEAQQRDKLLIETNKTGNLTNSWGWYQDAGDWDAYFSHSHIPATLLFLFESKSDAFKDNQLDIPESGNGLPDVLDEASWLMRFYQRTRKEIMDKGWGTGGVPGGRVTGDLWGTDNRPGGIGKTSDMDNDRDWYVSGEDPWMSYKYSAMAAQLAYQLEQLGINDPNGVNWKQEAIDTYNWARNNTKAGDESKIKSSSNLKDQRLYAAASLYRLTGDENYHSQFKLDIPSALGGNIFEIFNRDDLKNGVWIYLLSTNRNTDATLRAQIETKVNATADFVLPYPASTLRGSRFGGDPYTPVSVGQGTTPILLYGLTGIATNRSTNSAKYKEYLKYAYTTADYCLGGNPMNITWISGVGPRNPYGLFKLDWWFSNVYDPNSAANQKGIVPYGQTAVEVPSTPDAYGPWSASWAWVDGYGTPTSFPAYTKWPAHELWAEQRVSVLPSEYTAWQTNVRAAAVYGLLWAEDGGFIPGGQPPVTTGNGTGWSANYYSNISLSGSPVFTNIEAVDFNWTSGSPNANVAVNNFSVRWEGEVEAPVDGVYAFSTASDDGVRLWVNGIQIINNWTDHAETIDNGTQTFTFSANKKYAIKMEYYEKGGNAVAKLRWTVPGKEVVSIPKDRLYPVVINSTTVVSVRAQSIGNPRANINVEIMDSNNPTGGTVQQTKTFTRLSNTLSDYTATFNGDIPASRIRVRFPNDSTNVDLKIDYIKVNNVIYQSEDPANYSIGRWNPNTGCSVGGYVKTETIDCNGYIHYNAKPPFAPLANGINSLLGNTAKGFLVYPNPANGEKVTLVFVTDEQSGVSILVSDAAGRQLSETNFKANTGTNQYNLAVPFKPGLYFISILQQGKRSVQKLVIK
jgi:endoglucanase